MRLRKYWFKPQADVEFTWAEVKSLILFSERHYDHKCRALSKEGGVLYGMRNMFHNPVAPGVRNETILYRMDAETADLLAKTVESDPAMLHKFMPIVKGLNEKWRTINAENL